MSAAPAASTAAATWSPGTRSRTLVGAWHVNVAMPAQAGLDGVWKRTSVR